MSATQRRAFTYRDVRIIGPAASNAPCPLIGGSAACGTVRVAMLDGEAVGAYRLAGVGGCRVRIEALVVVNECRRRGVGRWLLGHALGVAENRGGRIVDAPPGAPAFFRRAGFAPCGDGLRLRLLPE